MTRMYEFDLFNHYTKSIEEQFYRIVVEAENEEEALEKAKKKSNEVAGKWIDLNDIRNHPFYLYKKVGFVSGWIPENEGSDTE